MARKYLQFLELFLRQQLLVTPPDVQVYILASGGVVLATENKSSVLYEDDVKIEKISDHIGCVYGGMCPDYR